MRLRTFGLAGLFLAPISTFAAPLVAEKQPINLHAIAMFFVFVMGTLAITWWAARQTRSTSDF